MKPQKPGVQESPKTVIRTSSENIIPLNLLGCFSLLTLLLAVRLQRYGWYDTHIINVPRGGTGVFDQRTKSLSSDNRMITLFSSNLPSLQLFLQLEKITYMRDVLGYLSKLSVKMYRNSTHPCCNSKNKIGIIKLRGYQIPKAYISHVCLSFC